MTPLVLLALLSSPFDTPEPEVAPSPREAQALTLDPGETVIVFDVSPIRPEAALVLKGKILFWTIGGSTRSMALPKDVAGSTGSLLLAGVGDPLEWDQVVPFFGRREIVKGSSYAYYETVSAQVMDDVEWRKKLPGLPRPKWIDPYLSPARLSCPAREP